MNSNKNSGLLTRNKIGKITDEDHLQEKDYLESIAAFARLTYESIYVIDYEQMAFEYVSENPLFLCGYTAAEVLELGYEFYYRHVPENDLALLNLINNAGFDFFERLPSGEKKKYTISYDFHLVNRDGEQLLVNHKLTPLFLTGEEKMWKAICIISLAHHQHAGNVFIRKEGADDRWELDMDSKTWYKINKSGLSKRETEVLRLYAQGLNISQIANKLLVAPDTVKYYRRRIFERLQVSNIGAALSHAMSRKII